MPLEHLRIYFFVRKLKNALSCKPASLVAVYCSTGVVSLVRSMCQCRAAISQLTVSWLEHELMPSLQVMDERQEEIAEIPMSTARRTDRLVEHPVLFPMLLEVRFCFSALLLPSHPAQ